MIDVLTSTKFVVDKSTSVKIQEKEINKLVSTVKPDDLKVSEIDLAENKWETEELIQITFIFNAINYCFWARPGEEKWAVDINGKKLDGAIALYRALEQEVKRNPDFVTGDYLESLSIKDLNRVLQGNIEISLLKERAECLNEAGRVLKSKFKGSFIGVYKSSEGDAIVMADLLISNFERFNDISAFDGKVVGFYKRAQLNSKMISDLCSSKGDKPLSNLDKLTAFADYKIPQKLRNLGILEYSDDLSRKIDSYVLIEPDSKEEVEIRSATVWAVELIKQRLAKTFDFVTSSHIDSMFWNLSQTKNNGEKPYHRTLTIAY
ncbi:MAG: queuosine salvage family protein [bacterium]|nr:queuosine salvage family protein [bacterium]